MEPQQSKECWTTEFDQSLSDLPGTNVYRLKAAANTHHAHSSGRSLWQCPCHRVSCVCVAVDIIQITRRTGSFYSVHVPSCMSSLTHGITLISTTTRSNESSPLKQVAAIRPCCPQQWPSHCRLHHSPSSRGSVRVASPLSGLVTTNEPLKKAKSR